MESNATARIFRKYQPMKRIIYILLYCLVGVWSTMAQIPTSRIQPADERWELYLPKLEGKRIALYANHTAVIDSIHLLDLLLKKQVNVVAIFAPEHGFRGKADAGTHIKNSIDTQTHTPILSLYNGNSKRPSPVSMNRFDILLVDIQDVGLRFYTYYITLCYLMEACADAGKQMIILDRPNPNGYYVDGPLLDMRYKSGVGHLPIPIVHGMTLGELALMINGERWLPQGKQCRLEVIPCANYTHQSKYTLPIAPSPNLPNMKSVYLYPSMCIFEGTVVSLGRGTERPFQIYGHPAMRGKNFKFIPRSVEGAKNPPLLNRMCYGVDLSTTPDSVIWQKGFDLSYVIDAYRDLRLGDKFFIPFFERLVGVDYVRTMIKQGKTAQEIKDRWLSDVKAFKEQRRPYLLYAE